MRVFEFAGDSPRNPRRLRRLHVGESLRDWHGSLGETGLREGHRTRSAFRYGTKGGGSAAIHPPRPPLQAPLPDGCRRKIIREGNWLREAEAQVAAPARRPEPAAVGRPAVLGAVFPAASPEDPERQGAPQHHLGNKPRVPVPVKLDQPRRFGLLGRLGHQVGLGLNVFERLRTSPHVLGSGNAQLLSVSGGWQCRSGSSASWAGWG